MLGLQLNHISKWALKFLPSDYYLGWQACGLRLSCDDMMSWWRHQMETFSALLAICVGNSPVPGEFPAQRPVTRSFDAFFDLRLNKQLSRQSWGWWFEMLPRPLWRHSNVVIVTLARKAHTPDGLHVYRACWRQPLPKPHPSSFPRTTVQLSNKIAYILAYLTFSWRWM